MLYCAYRKELSKTFYSTVAGCLFFRDGFVGYLSRFHCNPLVSFKVVDNATEESHDPDNSNEHESPLVQFGLGRPPQEGCNVLRHLRRRRWCPVTVLRSL